MLRNLSVGGATANLGALKQMPREREGVDTMREIELRAPGGEVVAQVEAAALAGGLTVLRKTLRKYPGCTHWHLVKSGERGTLEATWWPAKNRLWLSIHSNRVAEWHSPVVAQFQKLFPARCDQEDEERDPTSK